MRLSNRENTVSPALAHAPTGKRRDDFALGKFEHGKGNGGAAPARCAVCVAKVLNAK